MSEMNQELLFEINKLKEENKLLSDIITEISDKNGMSECDDCNSSETTLKEFLHNALSKQRHFLYQIIDTVPNLIYVKDHDNKYTLANEATAAFYGKTVKSIIGKTESELLSDQTIAQQIIDDDQATFKSLKTKNIQLESRLNSNKQLKHLRTKKIPIQLNSNDMPLLLCISTDITELKNNEAGLNYLNETLTKIYNSVHDAIVLFEQNGRITDVNERFMSMFDVSYNEALNYSIFPDYIDQEDEFERLQLILEKVKHQQDEQVILNVQQPNTGKRLIIEIYVTKINLGTGETILASINDITSIVKGQEMIEKLSAAVKQSPASVVITDKDGIIEYVNPKFTERTGYDLDEAIGKSPHILKSGKHTNAFYTDLWKTITSGQDWHGEICNINKAGDLFWESVSISPIVNDKGDHTNYVAVKEDITERKIQEEKIEYLALHDVLTDLPNRSLFMNRLETAVERAKRSNHLVALMFIDLDGFKSVNDTYGHKCGDEVLIATAERILNCHRAVDTTARIGGDEFVTILEDIKDRDSVATIAKRIVKTLSDPFECDGNICKIGCSIGISIFPDDATDIETLINTADTAMYEIKNTVKNNYLFYENSNAKNS